MSIYRGAGGAGDAVNDSSSEALLVAQLVVEAQADADAAQASATAAAGSASSASTSASNASTSATNASNSATSASTSASTATTQAGIATTKAGEAATSATNASNSASAASTSATNASNSATSAAGSATTASSAADAALAALDSFDDRYLGQKSTAPTVDNDGNALVTGALYFNTTTNEMKVWDGSAWLNAYASLSGALLTTNNLSDLNNTATARTNLGVAIGTNVQAYDADLAAIAALSPTADNFIVGNGTAWILETPAQARTSLGATTVGSNLVTLANPSAVTFPRLNADNTVSTLNAATFRTAIGAGTSSTTGTVTSVAALTLGTTGTDVSSTVANGTTTPVITLQIPTASASNRGALSTTDWSTFNGKQAALVSGTNIKTVNSTSLLGSGDVSVGVTSVTGTAPVVSSGGATPAISMAAANTSTNGYLTSTDWNTFNGKQAAGSYVTVGGALGTPSSGTLTNCTFPTLNQNTTGSAATLTTGRTIAITGDLAYTSTSFNGSANVTAAGTLATVNSNTGSFGSSTAIPVITVNGKGLVTAVSTATVAGGQYFGSAATKAIAYNSNTIGENVTVTTGNNGLSAGPITISSTFTVTVQTGAVWVIV